jgi:hypothetical protein
LDVDLGRRHVAQAAFQIPAAARELAIDISGDVEGAELVVDLGELRRHLGRFALQQADRLFGEDVSVNVDGLVCRCDHGSVAHWVCKTSAGRGRLVHPARQIE